MGFWRLIDPLNRQLRLFPYKQIACSVCLACLAATQAQAQPLAVSNQHPLAQLHLAPGTAEALPIPPGELEISLSGAWSNTVNRERDAYLFDTETREGALALEYGLFENLSFGLRQALIYRGGGITDSWIDDWHQTFGLPRGPRSKIPEDEYVMEAETEGGETFTLPEKGTHFSDLDLRAKYTFYNSADRFFSAALIPAIRLPSGAQGYGQDSVDYGLSAVFSSVQSEWQFDAGLSYFYFSDDSEGSLRYEAHHWNGFLGVEYRLVSGVSLLADVLVESALLKNVPQYPKYQTYLDLGMRIPILEAFALDSSIRENPFPEDSTTDFTLFAALHWKGSLSEARAN